MAHCSPSRPKAGRACREPAAENSPTGVWGSGCLSHSRGQGLPTLPGRCSGPSPAWPAPRSPLGENANSQPQNIWWKIRGRLEFLRADPRCRLSASACGRLGGKAWKIRPGWAKRRETGKGIPGGGNDRRKETRREAEQNNERLWEVRPVGNESPRLS